MVVNSLNLECNQLGFSIGVSSPFHPIRSTGLDDCSKSETSDILACFHIIIMQLVGVAKLSFLGSRFALP